MSRHDKSNDILTREKRVKVGKRVIKGAEPVALVGPEKRKDTLSLTEFAEALYGPGTKCLLIPAERSTSQYML